MYAFASQRCAVGTCPFLDPRRARLRRRLRLFGRFGRATSLRASFPSQCRHCASVRLSPATTQSMHIAVTISILDPVTREAIATIVLRDGSGVPLWTRGNVRVQPQGAQLCSTSTLPCVVRFSAVTVTGTVERAAVGSDAIWHPLLYLKTGDGETNQSVRLGPPEMVFRRGLRTASG